MIVLPLPYEEPPLRENDRGHWRKWAPIIAKVKHETARLAKKLPRLERCEIKLVWTVTTRHRRDAAGPNPTLKAAVDGLVEAGVIPDDNWRIVPRQWCEIELGTKPGVRIEITELGATT